MPHITIPLTRRRGGRGTGPRPVVGDPGHGAAGPVVRFTTDLMKRLQERIAAFEPERGGALLTARGVVREFVEDQTGQYSPVSWDISAELTEQVGEAEGAGLGVLAGTVHSHPDGVPDPSATDVRTTTHALEQNPHLDALLICVITRGVPRDTDVPVGTHHRMSIHILTRAADDSPVLERGRGEVVTADGAGPGTAPGQGEGGAGPGDDGFLPPEGDDALSRVRGLIGSLQDRSVVVAGCGSVGSRIAEDLVRSGVGRVVLIDPDEVSEANMARSVYTRSDVGVPKVWALGRRLRDISPQVTLTSLAGPLREHADAALDAAPDLLVLATDDMVEQSDLAARAYMRGIPQVGCALYRKAAAGEVCVVMPVLGTPCWGCAVGANQLSASERPSANYGVDTRLVAESGLGSSINLVASVASQAALAVLAGPGSVHGRGLVRLLVQGRTFGIVTTVPDWPVIDQVLPAAPHQSHPRSLWPVLQRGESCPICGPSASGPFTAPTSLEAATGRTSDDVQEADSAQRADDGAQRAGARGTGEDPEVDEGQGPSSALEALARELLEGVDDPGARRWNEPDQASEAEAGTGVEERADGERDDELVH